MARAVLGLSLRVSGCSVAVRIYSTLGVLGGSWGQTKLGDDIRHLASPGAMATGRPSPALHRHCFSPARALFVLSPEPSRGGVGAGQRPKQVRGQAPGLPRGDVKTCLACWEGADLADGSLGSLAWSPGISPLGGQGMGGPACHVTCPPATWGWGGVQGLLRGMPPRSGGDVPSPWTPVPRRPPTRSRCGERWAARGAHGRAGLCPQAASTTR